MPKRNNDFFSKKKTWSVVKDELLQCYLTPYVAKILNTGKPLLYVDCFAGAGKFADGAIGSPLIALNIFEERLKKSNTGQGNRFIEASFIELNHSEILATNLAPYQSYSNLKVSIYAGKYEKHIHKILAGKSNYNIFLYIDPYGIKHIDFHFLGSLATQNSRSVELLLNFNSFGFFRAACSVLKIKFKDKVSYLEEYDDSSYVDASEKMLNRVAGGDYWKEIVLQHYREGTTSYSVEESLTREFCNQLNKYYSYVLNIPIKIKENCNPKYRMIHATNHPDGAVLMADNIFLRRQSLRDIQLGGQQTLFELDFSDVDIRNLVNNYLSNIKIPRRLNLIIAEFFTQCGVQCSSKDIFEVIKSLEKEDLLELFRQPEKDKKGRPSKFYREGSGKTIQLKWKN